MEAVAAGKVLLVSTYELGRQPFGLASPARFLRDSGFEVSLADLALQELPEEDVRQAGFVAFHLPMHTATRMAVQAIPRIRALNASARIACYGLYAALNEPLLRSLGVDVVIGPEFESALVDAACGKDSGLTKPLPKLLFRAPDRTGLPPLERYARLHVGNESRVVGYTEASRGCKHLCRHCPIVPVYQGAFRVVQADVVLDDIRQQIASGAQHITFGDPDFLNGPGHATRIVEAFHREFPDITYDVTIKIEHLRQHRKLIPLLESTGCLFVTSAVESFDDRVLDLLAKGHTAADVASVLEDFRRVGLTLVPTFVAFTPWTTVATYRDMLRAIEQLGLIDQTAPIQLALRLLITAESPLLELPDIAAAITGWDAAQLTWTWRHPDPEVDALGTRVFQHVWRRTRHNTPRRSIFGEVSRLAGDEPLVENLDLMPRTVIPYLDEPWYC